MSDCVPYIIDYWISLHMKIDFLDIDVVYDGKLQVCLYFYVIKYSSKELSENVYQEEAAADIFWERSHLRELKYACNGENWTATCVVVRYIRILMVIQNSEWLIEKKIQKEQTTVSGLDVPD